MSFVTYMRFLQNLRFYSEEIYARCWLLQKKNDEKIFNQYGEEDMS